jgi:glutaconate CoA-transferase subunit A
MSPVSTVQDIAAAIRSGSKLAIPKDVSGPSLAVTRELIRTGTNGLHLVCVPVGGLQADLLIGAGAVAVLETSAVTLGEHGAAPRFTEAVRNRQLRLRDATCPAIYAALQAAEKGLPFIPLRGLIGTDVLRHRDDWKVIDNPFEPGDAIVALKAIQPDAALFHAPLADRHGNVFVGTRRELMLMAHAARETFVTVELPAIYVTARAHAPRGAAPLPFRDLYGEDTAAMVRYAAVARTAAGFSQFVSEWLEPGHAAA